MTILTGLTPGESIWKPKFIEEIDRNICLDCDRFDEVGGRNAFKIQSINKDDDNLQHQVLTIANPEQCGDCAGCTSSYLEPYPSHYSFSV
ncbi:MAG: hypothetical protein QNJ72_10445 [Pleurocapsa sp. MO_226.B13]|nr:hypothetical protein [Pleurocapsa sp. MO_226.B13]